MSKETGGLAFPFVCDESTDHRGSELGMTLRDYFAAKAMQSILSEFPLHSKTSKELQIKFNEYVSRMSYEFADAMIEARK